MHIVICIAFFKGNVLGARETDKNIIMVRSFTLAIPILGNFLPWKSRTEQIGTALQGCSRLIRRLILRRLGLPVSRNHRFAESTVITEGVQSATDPDTYYRVIILMGLHLRCAGYYQMLQIPTAETIK